MVSVDTAELGIHVELIGSSDGAPIIVLPGGGVRSPEYLGDVRRWGSVRPLAVVHYRGTPKRSDNVETPYSESRARG